MRRKLSVLAIAFIAAASGQVFGQSQAALPTGDQVLEKWVAAIGGRAAIEKNTSRVSKGTIESPGAPVTGTIEVSEKAPDKALSSMELQVAGRSLGVTREAFDGVVAW